MLWKLFLLLPAIQAAPVQTENQVDGTPKPTEFIYFGKVLSTDVNGRPIYPRVSQKGVLYPDRYVRMNPEYFPTDPSGIPVRSFPAQPTPVTTDSDGNFIIIDGWANFRPSGNLWPTDSDGRIPTDNLPTDEISCGCIGKHENGEHEH